jgi:hypothetical protein
MISRVKRTSAIARQPLSWTTLRQRRELHQIVNYFVFFFAATGDAKLK